MSEMMKAKETVTVSAEELRINLANYLGRVMYADDMIVVKKYNRDAAVILSPRMLRRLLDSAHATQKERAAALKRLDALIGKIPSADLADDLLSGLIDNEIKAVRTKKRA